MTEPAGAPRAVLFDMDGVLIDSYGAWRRVVDETRLHFGFPELTDQQFAAGWGQGLEEDVRLWFQGHTKDEVGHQFHERFPDHVDAITVIEGAHAALETLRDWGVQRACVTNTPAKLAADILQRTELTPLLEFTIGGDEVPHAKPAPDLLHAALERLALAPSDAWFVGDTHNDSRAAEAAGMKMIGFRQDAGTRVEAHSDLITLVRAP
ncbi:MAG: HAD family hydrolase [Planctomycetota bacterium]|jgi:HAD superfamily hydrolase (TIGR01509 family)